MILSTDLIGQAIFL